MTDRRLWRACKPWLGLALAVLAYAILRTVFIHVADGRGMLTPANGVDRNVAILGIAMIAMRVVVLVMVPAVVVYRLVMRLARYWFHVV